MPTQSNERTRGETLAREETVRAAIDAIVGELAAAQAGLTGARPADPDLAAGVSAELDAFAAIKGRGAFFPALGSGLGRGPLVELADGSVKWDMITGIGVHGFGHGDLELTAVALRAATADVVMQGNLQFNRETLAFTELLGREAGRGTRLRHCFLTGSGVMANESALKVCFQHKPGAQRVLAFDDCFMGRSTTMAQIGDSPQGRVGLPLNALVDYVSFYDPTDGPASIARAREQLETCIRRYPDQYACFVMELVQGEGGFNTAPREFFVTLMDLCHEHGIAVWADEVQTFGRTESLFHHDQLELGPYVDVVTIGKLSQVCACLYTEAMNPKPGLLSGTFVGSTVALAVGRRTIERLLEGGYYGPDGRNARLHAAFREHAAGLVERHPDLFPPAPRTAAPYGGVGGMMRLTPFGGSRARIMPFIHILFEEGVIAFSCGHGPYHARLLPPVGATEPEHLAEVFRIMERSLVRAARETEAT
jgi:4-aminobutyrate aminotransferase-like enzyme